MKWTSNKTVFFVRGLTLALVLQFSSVSFAGMAVSPLQQDITVKPGESKTFRVKVSNNNRGTGSGRCVVMLEKMSFSVSSEGKLVFDDESEPRSAADFLEVENSSFVLESGEVRELEIRVNAPVNADGDYWAALMFSVNNGAATEDGVNVKLRTASGVFVHVAKRNYMDRGEILSADVLIPEVSIPFAKQQQESLLAISSELKNTGLVSYNPSCKAVIYTPEYKRVANIEMLTNRNRVLPGHTRKYTGTMSHPLEAGSYKGKVFFETDSRGGRTMLRDFEFTIGDKLASEWSRNYQSQEIQTVEVMPEKLEIELTAGRFTAAKVLFSNEGISSVLIDADLQLSSLPAEWISLNSSEFTLARNMRKNVVCYLRIPLEAEPGIYEGTLVLNIHRSGLVSQSSINESVKKMPILVKVNR